MTFVCALFLPTLAEVAWEDKVQWPFKLTIYHLENMLIISGIHRLIHFSNRCAPNITNPPQYCFFFFPIIPSHLNAKTQKNPNPKSSIHPSLQAVFCFALFCDQGKGGGKEKRNIFAHTGAARKILGLILDRRGARYHFSGCSACAVHMQAQPEAAWEMETWAFPAFAFVKYSLAWLLVGKDQEAGWGPGLSLDCLARGVLHCGRPPPRSLQDPGTTTVQMLSPRTPVGRRAGKGQVASSCWGRSGNGSSLRAAGFGHVFWTGIWAPRALTRLGASRCHLQLQRQIKEH